MAVTRFKQSVSKEKTFPLILIMKSSGYLDFWDLYLTIKSLEVWNELKYFLNIQRNRFHLLKLLNDPENLANKQMYDLNLSHSRSTRCLFDKYL